MELAFVVGLLLFDEKDDLAKAAEKTAGAKSYFSTWSDELALMGNARPVSGASEWQAPDIVTWRTGLTEIVKKGDQSMSKGRDGWVKGEDDRRNRARIGKLKPAHETARGIIDKIESPKKGKDSEVDKVKYTTISGSLAGESLRAIVSEVRNLGFAAGAIDWKNSKAGVDVLIDKKSGRTFRIAIAGDLKTIATGFGGGGRDTTVGYKHSLEFHEYDTAKPMIDPEVKKALGMEE